MTYATRGLEPYRGFPQFMAAIASLQPSRQRMHAVIVGADAVFYGAPRDDGLTWKEATLRSLPQLDTTRVHFLGRVDAETHLRVLQASHAHVYLTVPFVLSWSLMESMAAGCPLVGSDTAPVREVIRDGETGLLADMRKPAEIADRIAWFLDHAADARAIGRRARIDATARYGLDTIMPQHMELAQGLTGSVARRTATG
ncbi:MAG: glycosyltransferase [Alphaproteobacteria bacterium]